MTEQEIKSIDTEELLDRGYTDLVGNLPQSKLTKEINHNPIIKRSENIFIKYNHGKDLATIYVPIEAFSQI